jgi:membrane-bound metal-dependent hydrolase YbcI (DUF457 family)
VPSPLAHIGIGLALHAAVQERGGRPWDAVGLLVAAASVAPDGDIAAAALLPGGIAWHRGPSHSLVGAALLGVLVARVGVGLYRRVGRPWPARATFTIVAAALAHVPLDWSTGQPGAPTSFGVPWAWPLTARKWIDPNPWFGAYHIDQPGFLANMFAPEALPVYGREAFTVLLAGLAAAAIRAARRGATARAT